MTRLAWKTIIFGGGLSRMTLESKANRFGSLRAMSAPLRNGQAGSQGRRLIPDPTHLVAGGRFGRMCRDGRGSFRVIIASRRLTFSPQSETVGPYKQAGGVTMRVGAWAIFGIFVGVSSLTAMSAQAQTAPQRMQLAQTLTPDDLAARPAPVARPSRRLRVYPRARVEADGVYPRYNPGPNAVRVCNASYAQEYRPSGTVIVPHMTCVWR